MPYGDLLEKAEFMQRLADARIKNITKPAEEPKTEEPAAKVRLDLDEAMRGRGLGRRRTFQVYVGM